MPPGNLNFAINWIEHMMLGSVATVVATLAVAITGLLLLDGRMDWRRGARTIMGCFLIFGAPIIAAGILPPATSASPTALRPAPEPEIAPPPPRPPEPYDPYAGAALPSNW